MTRTAFEMLSGTSTYNGEDPDTCTYEPPVLVLRLPLRTGDEWETSGGCREDGSDGGAPDDAVAVEVRGTATDTVGGRAVKTSLVRTTESFDSTDATTAERTSYKVTDTRHVDPDTLLIVVEDVTFEIDGDRSTLHRQLRSLTPA